MKTRDKQTTGLGQKTKEKTNHTYSAFDAMMFATMYAVSSSCCYHPPYLSAVEEASRTQTHTRTTETRVKGRKYYVALITSGKNGQKSTETSGNAGRAHPIKFASYLLFGVEFMCGARTKSMPPPLTWSLVSFSPKPSKDSPPMSMTRTKCTKWIALA